MSLPSAGLTGWRADAKRSCGCVQGRGAYSSRRRSRTVTGM
jgi:hypothetical protein